MASATVKVKQGTRNASKKFRLVTSSRPSTRDYFVFQDSRRTPSLSLTLGRKGYFHEFTKRCIDIFYAVIFLIVGIPWLIVCGLLMQREAPGPYFYVQQRVGRNGKILTVYKLRSMPVDAEENGPQLTPLNGDKRCGPVGAFIRKAKIDELPQFWNVLKGEFSVVGPRPERPYFVEKFSEDYPNFNRRHEVKPGLTGLAQLNEKDSLNMNHKLKYDIFYVDHRSFGLDQLVLWQTSWYCFRLLFKGFHEVSNGDICNVDEVA